MTKTMRMKVRPAALVIALLLGAGARVALGADGPAALYCGGTRDGYNLNTQINTADKRGSRNFGGTRDGYALGAALNTKMKAPPGTVILFR